MKFDKNIIGKFHGLYLETCVKINVALKSIYFIFKAWSAFLVPIFCSLNLQKIAGTK